MATTFAVPDGRVAMAATLWTGDGTTSRSIANTVNTVSFQPDLIWVKQRNIAQSHALTDSVRGAGALLASNATSAEDTSTTYGQVTAFSSTGFTASKGSDPTFSYFNQNTGTFVGWQWKAGGTAVSNTAGTITSSVSANTTAGFSVVTYTGTGANATVGHGLGVAPSMIIAKKTSNPGNWMVYHSGISGMSTGYIFLNTAAAFTSGYPSVWNSTAPAASVFSLGSDGNINTSGATNVAYCWAPVAGYSAFGSYTGNGSADGPFIYTGFRPRWLMRKRTDSSTDGSWIIYDTSRIAYNANNLVLFAEASLAEVTGAPIDILSNGFKLRDSAAGNTSGATYIYAAFAENPLRYSNAR